MSFADRVPGRLPTAWTQVTDPEIDVLREVIAWAAAGPWPVSKMAVEADVHQHEIYHFIEPARPGRPKRSIRKNHNFGLRMLWFAARLDREKAPKPLDKQSQIEILCRAADRVTAFEPDSDYFFRHLQRLNVVNEADCKAVCEATAGEYYSHRLSRNPGKIIRSHYDFLGFTPYNRLPHVINRLKYGDPNDDNAIKRTAEGQLVQMGDAYVLIGFVYRGFRRIARREQHNIKYDGLQINLFPIGQMGHKPPSVVDGVFLSFIHDDQRYEMGRMKLVRKTVRTDDRVLSKIDPQQIGEFTEGDIRRMEPGIDMSRLKLDVSRHLNGAVGSGSVAGASVLATCLSFALTKDNLFFE